MNFLIVLLTALLATHVSAAPTLGEISYGRRNENATILEMIAQYKQIKLKAGQAEKQKTELLAEAQAKQIEIQKKLGFSNDSTTPSTTSAYKSIQSSIVAETYTVLTATGSTIVFMNHGTTKTVFLHTISTTATTSIPPPTNSMTLTGSSSLLTPVPNPATSTATPTATASATTLTVSIAKEDGGFNAQSVTILTATGSIIVMASHGITVTTTLGDAQASPPSAPTATTVI